jgi:hypothetical protein
MLSRYSNSILIHLLLTDGPWLVPNTFAKEYQKRGDCSYIIPSVHLSTDFITDVNIIDNIRFDCCQTLDEQHVTYLELQQSKVLVCHFGTV